jgi:CspA family cold shock protein
MLTCLRKRNSIMPTGTVNRFNKIKGYGFITPDEAGAEVFVHFSAIDMAGYKELIAGQRIRYAINDGEKGPFATNVFLLENEPT